MRRMFPLLCLLFGLAACVSTPNTKALITPFGAAGYHTFAPPNSPDRMREPNVDQMVDRMADASRDRKRAR